MSFWRRLFGDENLAALRAAEPIVAAANGFEEAMKALGGIFWAEGGHAGSGGEILPLEPGDKVRIVLTPLQIKHGAHEEYPMNGVGIAIGRVQEERLVVVKLNKPFSPKGEGSVTEINVPASLLQRAE